MILVVFNIGRTIIELISLIFYEIYDKKSYDINLTEDEILIIRIFLELVIKLGSLIIFAYLFRPIIGN